MTQHEDVHPVEEGQVVDILTKRQIQRAADEGLVVVDAAAGPDAETIDPAAGVVGGPVDAPDEREPLYATVTRSADESRIPVVPAWLRNKEQRRQFARAMAGTAGYVAAFHTVRSPKYAILAAFWAIVGVFRVAGRQIKWWWVVEAYKLEQAAGTAGDGLMWTKVHTLGKRTRLWRGLVLGFEAFCLAVVGGLVVVAAPAWVAVALVLALVPALARLGRPADKPILDRVTSGPKFVKLTAEMVRTALVAIGAAKDPAQLTFPPPGIHRDGPGWLARVNLPQGTEAVDVLERRGKLSSALRLPLDQVWPAVGPEHTGQLDLWVGYAPSSKMGRAKWALASPSAVTNVFEPIPFGVDERMRPVTTTLFQRNYLIGGQPGSGKTFAGRALVLAALLDPTVEMWLAAFKASEDFFDVSQFCTRYECGVDDPTLDAAARMVADGLREVQRRQAVLGKLKRDGKIAEGRTDPVIARQGLGLHPLVLVFDEVHELFLHSKQAVEDMIRLVKQGRSAGVICILQTQVADKDSVPTGVTRCVSSRWCMSVADHTANDQIMGTSAHKQGRSGTAFRPEVDAGWGVTDGMAGTYRGPARAYYPDDKELPVLLDRIRAVRGGGGPVTGHTDARRDVLDDVRGVFYAGEVFASWQAIAARLAEQLPEHYTAVTAEVVSARLRAAGVASVDGKGRGEKTTKKGARREAVAEAVDRRALERGCG